jgi:toxin YoeB
VEINFTEEAQLHLKFWKNSGNSKVQKRIENLISDILLHPTSGIGKPEILKYEWSSYWSRRITREHRLVYKFNDKEVRIYSLKGHY